MKSTDNRNLFTTLIGADAASGDIAVIPTSQATPGDGTASIDLAFPPETFISVSAGGKRPRGQDVNGFLNLLSAATQSLQADFFGPYSASLSAAIGGYPLNAVVSAGAAGLFWVSTVEDNTTIPGASGANWQSLFANYYTQAQSDARFASLAGLATQAFSVLSPSNSDNSNLAAPTSWIRTNMQALVTSVITAVASATGFSFTGNANSWAFKCPTWLGGFIIQGGIAQIVGGTREIGVTFKMPFPNSYFGGIASEGQAISPFGGANPTIYGVSPGPSPTIGMNVWGLIWNGSGWSSPGGTIVANWIAAGY